MASTGGSDAPIHSPQFLSRIYSTIGICLLVVFFSAGGYFVQFHQDYASSYPKYLGVEITLGAILVVIFSLAFALSKPTIDFGEMTKPIPDQIKTKALPWLTAVAIAELAGLCWATGGSIKSPFSHYLVAISSIAIVLAKKKSSKLLMIAVCMVSYSITAYSNLSLTHEPAYLREFYVMFALFAVIVAATIGWRVEPTAAKSSTASNL